MRIGFLGLGTMGAPMAQRLIAAGHELAVWNRTPARAAPFAALGAVVASTPREAARGRAFVITMLSDEKALATVLHGDDGVLAGLELGSVLVDMSTVGRLAVLAAADEAFARGAAFLDAPVSGSRGAAQAGTLLVFAGGAHATFEIARPVLSALGVVRHVGLLGAGAAMKLCVNALGGQMLTALTSVLGLGERLGLDRAETLAAIQAGPFSSPLFAFKEARLLSSDPGANPDFAMSLWEKDQRLVLEEAARHDYAMPVLVAARAEMHRAISAGLGSDDIAAIMKLSEAAPYAPAE